MFLVRFVLWLMLSGQIWILIRQMGLHAGFQSPCISRWLIDQAQQMAAIFCAGCIHRFLTGPFAAGQQPNKAFPRLQSASSGMHACIRRRCDFTCYELLCRQKFSGTVAGHFVHSGGKVHGSC